MKSVKHYQDMSNKLTDKLYSIIKKKRQMLSQKIRQDVLLPFCRKHNLTMNINPYSNIFTTVKNHDVYEDNELPELFKDDPIAKLIPEYLDIYFMGDVIFDCDPSFDITKEDLIQ